MRKKIGFLVLVGAILLFSSVSFTQEPELSIPKQRPTRLFVMPTGEVQRTWTWDISFYSLGMARREHRFLGVSLLGLEDIVEIELSYTAVVKTIEKENPSGVPISAVKFGIPYHNEHFPSLAIGYRGATWWTTETDTATKIDYMARLMTYYGVASKRFGSVRGHFAASFPMYQLKTSVQDSAVSRKIEWYDIFNMLGVEWEIKPTTTMIVEIQRTFDYSTSEDGYVTAEKNIEPIWLILAGARFYATNWMSVDVAAKYQSNYDEKDLEFPVNASLGLNFDFPLDIFASYIFGKATQK